MTIVETAQQVAQWPVDDRLELIDQIWEQINADNSQLKVSDEMMTEFECRIAAHEDDPSRGRTWEQLVAHVKRDRN